ncbi:hypothetical protein DAEQUDRAFT_411695 [Daedalea quercina L-15889]|uniref:Uncharacterized protein n=1 Tax=Daedalea quercina L-15889 TaxID=1314783 RepID=A0A165NLC1_9APHY|nr:hypothetical protein DAEQUDRAFT_411695 [Daedalea quercina L-15889]
MLIDLESPRRGAPARLRPTVQRRSRPSCSEARPPTASVPSCCEGACPTDRALSSPTIATMNEVVARTKAFSRLRYCHFNPSNQRTSGRRDSAFQRATVDKGLNLTRTVHRLRAPVRLRGPDSPLPSMCYMYSYQHNCCARLRTVGRRSMP